MWGKKSHPLPSLLSIDAAAGQSLKYNYTQDFLRYKAFLIHDLRIVVYLRGRTGHLAAGTWNVRVKSPRSFSLGYSTWYATAATSGQPSGKMFSTSNYIEEFRFESTTGFAAEFRKGAWVSEDGVVLFRPWLITLDGAARPEIAPLILCWLYRQVRFDSSD